MRFSRSFLLLLKFQGAKNTTNKVDNLTQNGAVFKLAQKTLNIMWRWVLDALAFDI